MAALAARQHGNVTREQLLGTGLGAQAIKYRARIGRLHRVHLGVYSVGRPPVTPLERAAAAVLACGPGAALSHTSALALWGFAKRWPARLEVTVAADRRPGGITVHRPAALTRRDVRVQLGIRVTSPARTVLDCAPGLGDKQLTRTVNDARLARHLQLSELAELLARCPNHRGAGRLRPFVTTQRGPTRSELEDAFLAFCKRFELPRPLVNPVVAGYEVDALFAREKLIVELDGFDFHADRAAFERDRERDADTSMVGFQTVRITWTRLMQAPAKEAARLHAILRVRRAEAA